MPQLEEELWQVYKDEGLQAYALSSSIIGPEDPVQLGAFVDAMGLTMNVVVDYDATVYSDNYNADPDQFSPYPREFILDENGVVLYTSSTIDIPAMKAIIEAELGITE